ncbi:hypothetical protein P872_07375 [Rhodonellum psychrophilum GCM71 = DSM 17998]|uniref:Uncharacterized protein n=1 Tax=Rhodonellum psychrophilum GCM71 = DSM 17998 TaxID=1123057 RepID=U5BNU5_9BACT|nr:hypothetical protein P872_07375 [Rhodonellum psychrophilum GCM71 = DSM 17998]
MIGFFQPVQQRPNQFSEIKFKAGSFFCEQTKPPYL